MYLKNSEMQSRHFYETEIFTTTQRSRHETSQDV